MKRYHFTFDTTKKNQRLKKILLHKYKNLVVSRTFSKALGSAGLRIGYMFANDEIINILEKVIFTLFNIQTVWHPWSY